jgi:hypothetical protein
LIYPKFSNVSVVLCLSALILGYYIFNFSFSKSTSKIQIKLNNKKIIIEQREISICDIAYLRVGTILFNYYPKVKIGLKDGTKINFRIAKNYDFEKLVIELKIRFPDAASKNLK